MANGFENIMIRKVFRPRWKDITHDLKNLQNEKLHDLYSSLSTVRVTKSSMKWTANVACMGIQVVKSQGKRPLEDVVVVGRTILRLTLNK